MPPRLSIRRATFTVDEESTFASPITNWNDDISCEGSPPRGFKVKLSLRRETLDLDESTGNKRQSVVWSRPRQLSISDSVLLKGGKFGNTAITDELCQIPVNVQAVKKFAAKRPNSLNLSNDLGWTAFHFATLLIDAKWTQAEIISTFLKKGANIYIPNKQRLTPYTGITTKSYITKGTLNTICDAIKAYQINSEGRLPLYLGCHRTVKERGIFQAFSKVFKSPSGCPYIIATTKEGLHLIDSDSGNIVAVYENVTCLRFRTAIPNSTVTSCATSEVLFGSDGCLVVLSAPPKEIKKRKCTLIHSFRSPLTACDDDLIISEILGSKPIIKQSSMRAKRPGSAKLAPMSFKQHTAAEVPRKNSKKGDQGPPVVNILVKANPRLASLESDNSEPCCAISPQLWGSSVAVLQDYSSETDRFDFRVSTMLQRRTFMDCASMLGDHDWVLRYCHTSKKCISGKPVSLEHVGNGNYVCLSNTTGIDRVTVFSPALGNAFYPITLSPPSGVPIGISAKTTRDPETDQEVPLVAITTNTSIEVHRLNLTKQKLTEIELGEAKGCHYTTKLVFHILNSDSGGRYSCALSKGSDNLIILRGGYTWYDICMVDLITDIATHICKAPHDKDGGEFNTNYIKVVTSDDGEWVLRRNDEFCYGSVYVWKEIENLVGPRRINMTFAPIQHFHIDPQILEVKAPCGYLSLVFTDVQSSTEIWENEPLAMQEALELHNTLLRQLLLRFCGFEVKTEGDAFMLAFAHTVDALNWCLASQIILMLADWPMPILKMFPAVMNDIEADQIEGFEEEDSDLVDSVAGIGGKLPLLIEESHRYFRWRGLKVRMGIHSCSPLCRMDPATGRMDYFGPPVNLAARVSGHGLGGQIVISPNTYKELCLDPSPSSTRRQICDVVATSLGHIRLKGIREEKTLYEVLPSCLADRSEEFLHIRSERAITAGSPLSCAGSDDTTKYVRKNIQHNTGEKFNENDEAPNWGKPNCKICSYYFIEVSARFCSHCGTRREAAIPDL